MIQKFLYSIDIFRSWLNETNRIKYQYYSIPYSKYRIHITNRNVGKQTLLYYYERKYKMQKTDLHPILII